jgi:hypothetical protein
MTAIKQGDIGPIWRVGVNELDADGVPTGNLIDLSVGAWTCQIAVPSASTPILRAVTDLSTDNFRFLAQLAPAETALLADGTTHLVAIQIDNAGLTPPFSKEKHVELEIEEQKIS